MPDKRVHYKDLKTDQERLDALISVILILSDEGWLELMRLHQQTKLASEGEDVDA